MLCRPEQHNMHSLDALLKHLVKEVRSVFHMLSESKDTIDILSL